MEELIKIRDMKAKYDISARTLRCYKDMGLIPVPAATIMPIGCMMERQ